MQLFKRSKQRASKSRKKTKDNVHKEKTLWKYCRVMQKHTMSYKASLFGMQLKRRYKYKSLK